MVACVVAALQGGNPVGRRGCRLRGGGAVVKGFPSKAEHLGDEAFRLRERPAPDIGQPVGTAPTTSQDPPIVSSLAEEDDPTTLPGKEGTRGVDARFALPKIKAVHRTHYLSKPTDTGWGW